MYKKNTTRIFLHISHSIFSLRFLIGNIHILKYAILTYKVIVINKRRRFSLKNQKINVKCIDSNTKDSTTLR